VTFNKQNIFICTNSYLSYQPYRKGILFHTLRINLILNTHIGRRILSGAEAVLFASAVTCIIDYGIDLYRYSAKNPHDFFDSVSYNGGGCGVFSELDDDAKFTVLEKVAAALLDETDTCPELNHINESAISYVFDYLRRTMEDYCATLKEYPEEDISGTFGEEIIKAYNECFPNVKNMVIKEEEDVDAEYYEQPTLQSSSYEDVWGGAIARLEERILWGNDFNYRTEEVILRNNYYSLKKEDVIAAPGAMVRLYKLCSAHEKASWIDQEPMKKFLV
jgi:hypothetical protein